MYYFLLISGLYFLANSVYLSTAIFLGSLPSKKIKEGGKKNNKFAVIIPAHNEATVINRTLESIKRLDYPAHLRSIFVIADNCDDNTAEIARDAGVTCLERKDNKKRGKGFALQWFFQKAVKQNWQFDAFVSIDADTIVSRNLLRSMNNRLNLGHRVLTCVGNVLTPEKSPTLSISYIAYFLRGIRKKGRNLLGCTIPIDGYGMCISYDIIKKYAWNATSIMEDIEYWAMLHLKNIRVEFVEDTCVLTELPVNFRDYETPRARWDIGILRVMRKFVIPFVKHWLKDRTFVNFEAILALLTPPFTLFVDLLLIFFCLSVILLPWKSLPLLLYFISLFITGASVFWGLILAKLDRKVYKNLLCYVPLFMIWSPWNFFKRYWTRSRNEWLKSKRNP